MAIEVRVLRIQRTLRWHTYPPYMHQYVSGYADYKVSGTRADKIISTGYVAECEEYAIGN